MTRNKKPSTEDIALFREQVGVVRKLAHDKVEHPCKAQPPRPRRHAAQLHRPGDTFSDAYDAGTVSPDDTLFFARPGLQQRQLQRLRRGQLAADAELDLHGMTIAVARQALTEFITLCSEQHIRSVRIIHGKGAGSGGAAPVLKNRVNSWLRQHHDVLAFSSAQPRHGGTGALYVLLRSAPRD
ncbi:MAG TPA: Smr/MutS family protein [Gammaproteobacteria bacterium]|nr:Smr/MutS family protein [Gammaproteobacteria bacterium]